jgi:hypothetical protein
MNLHPADLARIRAALAEVADETEGDDRARADTLEMLTDADAIADALLAGIHDDEDAAEACDRRAAQVKARKDRHLARRAAKRQALVLLLGAMGVRSWRRPLGTLSLRRGSLSLAINEAELPSELFNEVVKRVPDKDHIRRLLDAGETVPGAEWVRGDDTLSIGSK